MNKEFQNGIRDGIPIALGYLGVSFTFGIMGSAGGLSWWQTVLISMTNVTSAGQFAGLNIMLAAGGYFEMALAQFVINLRYSLMSISLSQKVDRKFTGIFRWIFGFVMTDEIFAVAAGHKGAVSRRYFLGLATLPYFGWAGGTLAGAILGDVLPELVVNALSVALYGMFIAIVVPAVRDSHTIGIPVAIAIVLSFILTYVPGLNQISVGFAVIICAVIASVIGAIFYPIDDEEEEITA